MVDAGYVKSYYIDKKIHYGSIQVRILSWLQKLKNYDWIIVYVLYFVYLYGKKTKIGFW